MLALKADSLPIEAVIVHWYDNGFHAGNWSESPNANILAVEWIHNSEQKTVTYGVDYYAQSNEKFGGTNVFEQIENLDYKEGMLISDEEYKNFLQCNNF